MQIQGKIWGQTQTLFQKPNFEFHRIEVNKGSFCSTHKHNNKFNSFYVESGQLKITIHQTDYGLVDDTIMKMGDLTIVKPGLFHSFEAIENTVCFEIYWTELDHNDIQRENVGGKK